MLRSIRQTDRELLIPIQKYGCLFLCFAYSSPIIFSGGEIGRRCLNVYWEEAVDRGYISGDFNGDGDYDDVGEAEVKDHNGLCRLFLIPCRYDDRHHSPEEKIPDEVEHVFGCYRWKSNHFVVLDKNLNVVFDPIGKSNTVANGVLKSTRWYYKV